MADKLTPQQAQAVHDRGGKLLVSAAAGSGKTKVLVDRLLEYILDPVNPANLDDFLIITYTKMAASELRGKIAAKLTERIAQEPENRHLQKQMQRLYLTHISTVHGFCTNLLREYAYRLDLSADFRVADEAECQEIREAVLKDLLDRAYETMGEDPEFCAFVDTQGVGRNDGQVPVIIQKVYDSSRCHLDPDGWLQRCLDNVDVSDMTDAGQTVWGEHLMQDLQRYLDSQITVLSKCRDSAASYPELKKQAANLDATIEQMQWLRAAKTWDEVIARKNLEYGLLRFPKNNPDLELAEEIKAVRDACKKGLASKLRSFANPSEQVLADLQQSAAAAQGLIRLVRQFDQDYRNAKRSRRILDFSDLEQKTLDLLKGKQRSGITSAAQEIGRRFREIMVDEYQDSNEVQDAVFDALTQERQNCFMVGDVKQSIYQFRLADPKIFLKKYQSYHMADQARPGEGRKVLLSHNFRSGCEVIDGINDVFRVCMSERVGGLEYGDAEALREGVPHVLLPDPAVELYAIETDEDAYGEEAAFIAQKIRQMLTSGTLIRDKESLRPVTAEDIVILLRSPNSVGKDYQRALQAQGIRCAVNGGMDLLQTPEIGTFRALLQTIVNPRQDIPLLSTLASPLFGFTADDLAAFRSHHRKGFVYDALRESELPKAKRFLEILDMLRREARTATLTQLLERCILLTRPDNIYGAMPGGQSRKNNLQVFFQMAVDYEKTGLRSLDQFLDHLASLEADNGLKVGSSSAGCVRIMSIHKSKGLEFPVVFLGALARGFNQESIREHVLCSKDLGLGLSVVDSVNRIRYSSLSKWAIRSAMDAESVSEELRVLYVAMTRAKDRLVMTYAAHSLVKDLKEIALRLAADNGRLVCAEASCPGDWILAAALQHTEAGELHAIGGRPRRTRLPAYPWKISYVVNTEDTSAQKILSEDTEETVMRIPAAEFGSALAFQYPHSPATEAPSKQTATGRKGRIRDEEVRENTPEPKQVFRSWRKPSFRESKRDGRAYGTAFHSAMQYIRYENCKDRESVEREIDRLIRERYLSEEQGKLVDRGKITAFFSSALGQKLVSGIECLREFKFSILDNGSQYGAGLEAEEVLLQGVVDCAILEPDGITILDFKTDRITEAMLPEATERHRIQVNTYADALRRIYRMPIKAKYLYFVTLDQFAEVN